MLLRLYICPLTRWVPGGAQDAYVLGRILSAPVLTRRNIPAALNAFDAVRRPHAQAVVQSSRTMGLLMDWVFTTPDDDTPVRDETAWMKTVERESSWAPKGDIEDQVKTSLGAFEASTVPETEDET